MSRAIAALLCAFAVAACSEATNKPAQDPSSTTSVTSAPESSGQSNKTVDPSEERAEHSDSLRN